MASSRSVNQPFGRNHALVCTMEGGIIKKEETPMTRVTSPCMRKSHLETGSEFPKHVITKLRSCLPPSRPTTPPAQEEYAEPGEGGNDSRHGYSGPEDAEQTGQQCFTVTTYGSASIRETLAYLRRMGSSLLV